MTRVVYRDAAMRTGMRTGMPGMRTGMRTRDAYGMRTGCVRRRHRGAYLVLPIPNWDAYEMLPSRARDGSTDPLC